MKRIIPSIISSTPVRLGILLGLLGAYLCYQATSGDQQDRSLLDFFLNAGTELLGIAITVAFVQVIFDSLKKREDVKSLTWDILIKTDYAIWVWQGGERIFNLSELQYLIKRISPADPCAKTTQNLLLSLGNEAEKLTRTQEEMLKGESVLRQGLFHLTNLATIRDDEELKPSQEIALAIKNAVDCFAKVLRLDTEIPVGMKFKRNCSEKAQVWRHTGQKLEPTSPVEIDIAGQINSRKGVN